jgi:hypothetical protein
MVIFVYPIHSRFIACRKDGALNILDHPENTGLNIAVASSQFATGYKRYAIETKNAPPRRKSPHPFNPTVRKIGLAKILLKEAAHYGFRLRQKGYRDALLSRPCIYGVFSGPFGGFQPIREKCTGCMRCVQEYPDVCSVDRNPEFYQFADSYWASEGDATTSGSPVATVSYEAETGKIPIKGMGYKGAFAGPGWDSIWTDMSEIVRPTRDGVYGREFISTIVDVGRKRRSLQFERGTLTKLSKVVEVSLPIIFDYLPRNMNSQNILESIAGACARTDTFFIASTSQAKQLPKAKCHRLIPLVSPANSENSVDLFRGAPWIELESSDPFSKEDQIEWRKVDRNTVTSVRLPLNQNAAEKAVELTLSGVNVLHLTANYHGEVGNEDKPTFVKDLIRLVHGKLVSESCRDEVTLIASGGITRAEHVPKAIICGADLVAIDTTALVALQSRFEGECISPESGRIIPERFDSGWGEQRLVNLLASWHDQLIEILSAMGIRDVRRLRGDVGRAMFNEDLEKEAFKDIARRD